MYSPKIKDELIPKIYEIAKARGMRMTTLVNEILGKALNGMEGKKDEWTNKDGGGSIRGPGKNQG
jgi:hypothetical protein